LAAPVSVEARARSRRRGPGGAAAQPAAPGGFRQPSSALSPALLGALTARVAGDPLTTDQERQRIASGWDARGP